MAGERFEYIVSTGYIIGQEAMRLEGWKLIAALIPLILIELGLLIVALVDLVRRPSVRGGNKIIWALLIIFSNIIGPIIYLLWGREREDDGAD